MQSIKKRNSPPTNWRFSLITAFLGMLLVASTLLVLVQSGKSTQAATPSFTFTVAGDYGQTSNTTSVLQYINQSGAAFNLALGDFSYDPTVSADTWSSYAKTYLPSNFPFEIVAGDHDTSQISRYGTDLPPNIALGSHPVYPAQYYFDYPPGAPLARFIMLSPGNVVSGYSYAKGTTDYNWVSNTIDNARASGIQWVIVGMAEGCIFINSPSEKKTCVEPDLFNLLVSKNVDLILQAHLHNYEAGKQLAINGTTCTSIPTDGTYNSACISNASSSLTKGAGTTIVVTGTGGQSLVSEDPADPKIAYFRTSMASNTGNSPSFGVSQFNISTTKLTEKFVPITQGAFTDSFTITNNKPTPTPSPSPSPSPSVTASPSPSPSPSVTPSPSPCPTLTPSPLPSPSPSVTASPSVTPSPSPCPTLTPSPSPSPNPGGVPVSTSWYFAEGKVGAGFTEYITFENPDPINACRVNLQYLLGPGTTPAMKSIEVQPASRSTTAVNSDLNTPASGSNYLAVSAVATVNTSISPNCTGVVAERPMYFTNFTGVSSGDDVVGFTKTGTKFLFADVPTGGGYSSFLTVLNPASNTQAATVTAIFYANGQQVATPTPITVNPGTRGTIIPNNASSTVQHAAVVVTSTQPVMVERPSYFSNVNGGNAGTVSGAASVIGVQADSKDWLFAEGYTGAGFQEDLVLSNFGTGVANASVKLEYSNGSTQAVSYQVNPNAQTLVDVNMLNSTGAGTCTPSPCQPTPPVSAEVTSDNPIVAQREMFFHYNSHGVAATGVSDATGFVAPAASAYTFAEGYTNKGYNEWLTLQNPTSSSETINITLVNGDDRSYQFQVTVGAFSRSTVDITGTVATNLIQPQDTYLGYEVSMVVQSIGGVPFVAERPMYWNASGTQGGSDIFGYTAGA